MTNLELRRDPSGGKVAGVCAGLARSWNVDPLLVRLGFVVAALMTNGFAVIAYLALAVMLPEPGARSEPIRDLLPVTRDWPRQKLLTVVAVATLVLGTIVSASGPGSLVVALLILGIMRWGRRTRPAPPPPAAPPRTEFERLSATWTQRLDNVAAGLPPDWAPANAFADPDPYGLYTAPGVAPAAPRHPARRRRALGTWSGVAVGLGLAWTALGATQALGAVTVPTLAWCAATLAVLALALVAVARPARAAYGRPAGLLAASVITALVTGAVMIEAPGIVAGGLPRTSETTITYSATALPQDFALDVGSRTIDLTAVTIDRDHTTRLSTDVGRLRVLLPPRGNVVVRYRVDAGSARVGDTRTDGLDTSATWSRVSDPGGPTLTLDLSVDLGALEVVVP